MEFLRPQRVMEALGAIIVTGVGPGSVDVPTQATGGTMAWKDESSVTVDSTPTAGSIDFDPHEGTISATTTRKALANTSPIAELILHNDITRGLGQGLDQAFISGTGSGQPEGVEVGATLSSSVAVAGTPSYVEALEFVTDVAGASALYGSLWWLTTPAVWANMKSTLLDGGSGRFLIDDINKCAGYPVMMSTIVTANKIVFGNFADYLGMTWSPGVDLLVYFYSVSSARQVRIYGSLVTMAMFATAPHSPNQTKKATFPNGPPSGSAAEDGVRGCVRRTVTPVMVCCCRSRGNSEAGLLSPPSQEDAEQPNHPKQRW